MTKKQAKAKFILYLKERNINFLERLSDGKSCIFMVFRGYERCPDKALECSIFFYDTYMEARVYYTANASKWISEKANELSNLYRVLNYIQANVWPFVHDNIGGRLYSSPLLNGFRLYITEDGNYDLTTTILINYNAFEFSTLEIADYLTVEMPALMDSLSIPIFFVLFEKITPEESIALIKRDVLKTVG